ncbi:MAG TPA: hypothetical protein PLU54_09000 [Deltaproteobacteria bacterium]|nr:hypothetical protein [Deltaproteobacteria bacterium]
MRLRSPYDIIRLLKPPRGFRLTVAGRIFFAFLTIIILIALATGNNLLYLVLAGMLAFMIVSGIESEMNLRHLELDRVLPAEVHAGIPATVTYLLKNPRNRSHRLTINDLAPVRIMDLQADQTHSAGTDITFGARGVHRLPDITISTTYPYGLFEKSITFDAAGQIVVFPRPLMFSHRQGEGARDTGSSKATDSISHVRPYSPGDPLSSVVWKKQHLGSISRVFEGGSGMSTLVVLTPGPDMETKLSQATYVIDELHRSGLAFGLVLNTYSSGMDHSREHKIRILTRLSQATEILQPSWQDIPPHGHVISI